MAGEGCARAGAPDGSERLLAAGDHRHGHVQALINFAVCLEWFATKGIPASFHQLRRI